MGAGDEREGRERKRKRDARQRAARAFEG